MRDGWAYDLGRLNYPRGKNPFSVDSWLWQEFAAGWEDEQMLQMFIAEMQREDAWREDRGYA
jgi:hypothetical protein